MADAPNEEAESYRAVEERIRAAVTRSLAETRFAPDQIDAIFDIVRQALATEVRNSARIRLHGVRAEGDQWVDADEAFLSLSAADPKSGQAWLSETRWLSPLVLAESDPDEVRRIAQALERSLSKIRAWLAEREAGAGTEPSIPRI